MNTPRPRILAIDDNPANLMTLGVALEGEFELQIATSGPQGIEQALANPPDLILMDVMMPLVDGFETFKRLAAQPTLRDIPVIFVTALDDTDTEVAALALGAADFITKPINVTIARHRIRNLVRRQRADAQLKLAASVFSHSREGITIADATGLILDVNAAFSRITGYSREEVVGQNSRMLQSGRHNAAFYTAMWDDLLTRNYWAGEIWNRHKNGEMYAEMLTISVVRDGQGAVQRFVALFSDITERKAMEEQVHRLAFYDVLTGLPNRRMLDDRLTHTMAASKRSGLYGALMFLDLDNFKPLNDQYGHWVGDLLLMEVARRLSACVREVDTVARFGGDEFVVMLSELDADAAVSTEQARGVAEKIRASLALPYNLTLARSGQDASTVVHHCTASVGVVVFVDHEASQGEILKRADIAMYQAKDAGRNVIRFYA